MWCLCSCVCYFVYVFSVVVFSKTPVSHRVTSYHITYSGQLSYFQFTKFQTEGLKSQNPCFMLTSKCPLKIQISKGLGPCFQIELLKTGRSLECVVDVTRRCPNPRCHESRLRKMRWRDDILHAYIGNQCMQDRAAIVQSWIAMLVARVCATRISSASNVNITCTYGRVPKVGWGMLLMRVRPHAIDVSYPLSHPVSRPVPYLPAGREKSTEWGRTP